MDRSATLPGLPVPLRVTVHNGDVLPFTVTEFRVRITSPDGGRFLVRWPGGREYKSPDTEDETVVLPGQSKMLTVPMKDFLSGSGEWTADSRLHQPGDYQLAVLVRDASREDVPAIASREVKVAVHAPTGADAEIWERIRRGELFTGSLANEVFENSPESAYMPALATLIRRIDPVEKIRDIERVYELHPQSPFRSFLRLTLAGMYQGQAYLVIAKESGRTLMATSRSRRVSFARDTSPIPPAPMRDTISYGPSRTPLLKFMGGRKG
jgi:hypothetical protein